MNAILTENFVDAEFTETKVLHFTEHYPFEVCSLEW